MNYVKAILSALAAIFLAWVVILWPLHPFTGISEQKATGVGIFVVAASPLLWILAVWFFGLFFAASRMGNRILKTFLFWIPTVLLSTLGVTIFALFTFIFLFFRLKHP